MVKTLIFEFTMLCAIVVVAHSATAKKKITSTKNAKQITCKKSDIYLILANIKKMKEIQSAEKSALMTKLNGISTEISGIDHVCECNAVCECDAGKQCPEVSSIPKDCSAILDVTGAAVIKPAGQHAFRVFCEKGWTYIAKRFDGTVDFYRTWAAYQRGFGNLNGEHFIGLDNLVKILLQKNYKLRIELETWPGPIKTSGYAEYAKFDLADDRDNYRLTIGGFSGDAKDSLATHNGYQFSTYDNDHDVSTASCASVYKGAWWYSQCHASNLFGIYSKGPNCTAYAECIAWKDWPEEIGTPHNYYYSFREVRMKIFPLP